MDSLRVFIGHDKREQTAYNVCKFSLERHSSIPLEIEPISSSHPLYKREWHLDGEQKIDNIDGRPFSTDFAFARFLVPAVSGYSGWALFCDCDFLFRADIAELLVHNDTSRALYCVHHNFWPNSPIKMDNKAQQPYYRKCWSSFALWNCGHPANRMYLTPDVVNKATGRTLHTFSWLEDSLIGSLSEEWNWLGGHSSLDIVPKAIHYTEGGPWFPHRQNVHYALEWKEELALYNASNQREQEYGREEARV